MTIDPKEQAMLNALKKQFVAEKISENMEGKIMAALNKKFAEDEVTTPEATMKLIRSTVTEELGNLKTEVAEDNKRDQSANNAKNKAAGASGKTGEVGRQMNRATNQIGGLFSKLADAADRSDEKLKAGNQFNTEKHYTELNTLIKDAYTNPDKYLTGTQAQASSKETAPAASAGAASTPSTQTQATASTVSGQMTDKEAAYLDKVKAQYTADGKKMSGLETAIYTALEKKFNEPGQTGSKDVEAIITEASKNAIAGVKDGSQKLGDLVNKVPESKLSGINEDITKVNADYKTASDAITTQRTDIEKDTSLKDKKKTSQLEKLEKEKNTLDEKTTKKLNPLNDKKTAEEKRIEDTITGEVKAGTLLEAVKSTGFPEVTDTTLIDLIKAADKPKLDKKGKVIAAADGKLDVAEIQALIKNPDFIKAAQQITGEAKLTKVTVHNDGDDGKDTIKIGDGKNGGTIAVQSAGVAIDDSIKSGADTEIAAQNVGKKPPAPKGKQH